MDKKEVHSAAVATTEQSGSKITPGGNYFDTISFSVLVNARGRVCMLYDKPFNATPVWVKYLTKHRKLQLIFDNGMEYVINYIMDEKLNKMFLNLNKVFIVRFEDMKPIEGFDTNLIKE
ncbi:MAG: hypothetical protein EB059_03785 [Alphaproteobacteria bacterium]|nr:hypothetical protein [Alphaproteobacteria bacterium]